MVVVVRGQEKKVETLKHFFGPLLEFFLGAKLRVSVGGYEGQRYREA